jgi:uncharacterized membrane protein YphA (DoxX/SURF4 family)
MEQGWLRRGDGGESMNPSFDWKKALWTLLRVACGIVVLVASQDKLGDAAKFTHVVEGYHILPLSLVPLAAVVIPWLEFFTGVCLVLGLQWRGAALVFCALMAVYTFSLSWNLLHGVEMNCGCFSMDSTEKTTWWTVVRDLVFLVMGLGALLAPSNFAQLDSLFCKKNDE